ncbi:MAG TPA: SDR family oxidoreductase [Thermoanaerobaculia bacterium]|nr:SDR family oxidoreductase [Thermoanaerobaculia bacterium]
MKPVKAGADRPLTGSTKAALITGAGRGLGRILAGFLAKQGFALVITSKTEADLLEAASEFDATGGSVVSIPGDVSLEGHRRRLILAAEAWGRIDVLVNNASDLGETPLPPLVDASRASVLRVFDVNTLAPLALIQEALPLLKRSHGLVVNISSDAAIGGYPGWGVYGASKAALDLFTKTLAAELRDEGVGVVSVDPGDMRTKMHQDAYPGQDISDRPLPDVTLPFWAWLLSQSPMAVSGGRFQAQAAIWEVPA